MKFKEIMKILEVVLLLTSEKESLLTIEANYGIEKPYILRGAKIYSILKSESSPEDDKDFLSYVSTQIIPLKGGKK